MKEDHFNTRLTSYEQKESKCFLNIYCQPCLKRGLLNVPAYVNLNEFENNRYICESCSFGQTYIIALGKNFLAEQKNGVKLENRLKMRSEETEKDLISQNIQTQKTLDQTILHLQEPKNNQINIIQDTPQLDDQDQTQLPEFVKNVQINSNPESQYSLADIGMYTENILQEYKKSLDVIDKYEEMNKAHINKWRNTLKAQFQGVIGTFGNSSVGNFLKELKQMEETEQMVKQLEQSLKQAKARDKIQTTDVKERQQVKLTNIKAQLKSIHLKNLIKSQQPVQPTLSQIYTDSVSAYKLQQEKIALYVETLKMSGIRNLSNLKSLYNCCKGFSDAVRILISLEHKETNRRFDFITQKFKVCSIETLYDAEMINGGYLDNRLQRPPVFDVIEEQMEKMKNQDIRVKSIRKEDFSQNRKIESKVLKQTPSETSKLPIKQYDEPQKKCQIKDSKSYHKSLTQEISLLSSQSQREESIILQNTNDVYDGFSDNSNENKNCPFPSLKKYYQYQKGRNLFVSELELTQENFQTFPPFEIYLPSVESLTIKYCPPATDPWQLVRTLRSCFRKLNELRIEDSRLGTKEMIMLIAEYFPKLKSFIIRCRNEFDLQLSRLFQKKMVHLVRLQVNSE